MIRINNETPPPWIQLIRYKALPEEEKGKTHNTPVYVSYWEKKGYTVTQITMDEYILLANLHDLCQVYKEKPQLVAGVMSTMTSSIISDMNNSMNMLILVVNGTLQTKIINGLSGLHIVKSYEPLPFLIYTIEK